MLDKGDKYFCEFCQVRQEAFKKMKIKSLPNVLLLHLKRFKFVEKLGRFVKLSHRVDFPDTLILPSADSNVKLSYSLNAIVAHIGSGMRVGHYVTIVKVKDNWFLFDDDDVSV